MGFRNRLSLVFLDYFSLFLLHNTFPSTILHATLHIMVFSVFFSHVVPTSHLLGCLSFFLFISFFFAFLYYYFFSSIFLPFFLTSFSSTFASLAPKTLQNLLFLDGISDDSLVTIVVTTLVTMGHHNCTMVQNARPCAHLLTRWLAPPSSLCSRALLPSLVCFCAHSLTHF